MLKKSIVLLKKLKVTMFNFDELKVIKGRESEERKCGPFVGIRRDEDTNEMHFILPRGFEDFDPNYDNIKKLFFNMYKTFKKFVSERRDVTKILDDRPQSKDNVSIENNGSYSFTDSDDNEVIMYSKIEMIEAMIQVHKELDVEALIQELGLVEEIDYSKIDNLIDNGIFLKNNSILIESMAGERNVIQGVPAEIIEIYCYIYNEILVELEYDVNDRVKDIAYNFSYKYLTAEQGLFNEYTFESTVIILKDRLDLVHRHTAYKDSSYWLIYDAVEKFLYSDLVFESENKKGFWGINNFSQIWEDMCNMFFIKEFDNDKVIYCDSELEIEKHLKNLSRKYQSGFKILVDKGFESNFFIGFNESKRWMRPDLVVHKNYSPINILERKGSFFYEFIRSDNSRKTSLFTDSNIKIKLQFKFLENIQIDYQSQLNTFDSAVHKIKKRSSKFNNDRNKKIKNYPSLIVTQINPKLYYLNGMSESDFIVEWKNIALEIENDNKNSNFDIGCIDWKYLPLHYFDNNHKGLESNIIKQLTYEFCLYNNKYCNGKTIKSQFGVPYYMSENQNIKVHSNLKGIDVCKLNFNKVQSVYLNA